MNTLTKFLRHLITANGYDKPFPEEIPVSSIPVTDELPQIPLGGRGIGGPTPTPIAGFPSEDAGYRAATQQSVPAYQGPLDSPMAVNTRELPLRSSVPSLPMSGSPPVPVAPEPRYPETAIGQPPTRTGATPPFSQAFKKVSPWKAAIQNFLESIAPQMQQASQNARGGRMDAGDFFTGLAGAGGSAVGGAISPGRVQERNELREVDRRRQLEEQSVADQMQQGKLQDMKLDQDYRREQILAAQRKPGEAEAKAHAKAQTAGQSAIFRNLGLYRGQKFDTANPRHNDFLMRAEQAGIFIDPDEWNNATGNEAVVTMIDPENPTQTQRVMVNKATGAQTVLGQGGYVQPVNRETGMTPAQTAGIGLQRSGQAATESRFERSQAGIDRRAAATGTSGTARPSTRADRTAAQALLNQERDLRTKAASADTEEARAALNSQADEVKADLLTRFPDAVEEVDASTTDRSGYWPKTTPKTKLRMRGSSPTRSAAPQGRPQSRDQLWKNYVRDHFNGDENAARAYQNQ